MTGLSLPPSLVCPSPWCVAHGGQPPRMAVADPACSLLVQRTLYFSPMEGGVLPCYNSRDKGPGSPRPGYREL